MITNVKSVIILLALFLAYAIVSLATWPLQVGEVERGARSKGKRVGGKDTHTLADITAFT
jgi:hypothetical protein